MKTRSEVLAEKKMPKWERGANAEQLEVIQHESGPCRVLASAGSGKTFAVTRRIARLVRLNIIEPERILATTFSKKAAEVMTQRVHSLDIEGARVGTWHSLCLQILQKGHTKWSNWEIDGADDTPRRAKYILKDVLGYKHMDWKGADLTKVNDYIGKMKANLYSPDSSEALQAATTMFAWAAPRAVEAFHRYNEALAEKELLTFDDFLVFACEHLADPIHREEWAAKYDALLCDEVQDNNRAQETLSYLLAGLHRNYMAVGDCFQSIFAFRGSSPMFLANFEEKWPGAKTIWLPRNYRSGRKIIAVANKIVKRAVIPGLEAKDMIGERDLDGSVRVICSESLDDEAHEIVGRISESVKAGDTKLSDHTVLYRTNAQSRAIEEALLKVKIPYIVVGGVSFYERKEVKDLLAYLRLAAKCGKINDIKRSINTPFRFLGAAFVDRITDKVDNRSVDDADWPAIVIQVSREAGIQKRQSDSAHEWARLIRLMQDDIAKGEEPKPTEEQKRAASPAILLEGIIRSTRYIEALQKEEGEENTENSGAANVREMIRVAERFTTAVDLLEYIDETIRAAKRQREDKQAGGQRVLMMSIHRSKGLEWPHVYIAGMNEMILPHAKGDLEEERRLAYVAVTRARDVLTLSYVLRIATRAGIRAVLPSPFLLDTGVNAVDDLPDQELEFPAATSVLEVGGSDSVRETDFIE